jgi:hypothetical protein
VTEPRRHWRLRTEMTEQFNQACASLYVVDDTQDAIDAYRDCSSLKLGELYLLTYGALEALFLQQNAVEHLCAALGFGWRWGNDPVLKRIREIRNRASGHPTRKERPDTTFHMINQSTLQIGGFELMTWTKRSESYVESIDLRQMMDDQEPRLEAALDALRSHMEYEDAEHRAQFRDRKLAEIFRDQGLGYAWEKLGEPRSGSVSVGSWAASRLAGTLDCFRNALAERGIGIDTYGGVKGPYKKAEYVLAQLTQYFSASSDRGDIVNDRAAGVFRDSLRLHFTELESMAKEIDSDYMVE